MTVLSPPLDPTAAALEGPWTLTGVGHRQLVSGETEVVHGPLLLLVLTGSVEVTTDVGGFRLEVGDATLLAGTARRVAVTASESAALATADLEPPMALPSPLVLPGFTARHPGITALVEQCPLGSECPPRLWLTSYAGLLGIAVLVLWQELDRADPGSGTGLDPIRLHERAEIDGAVARVLAAVGREPGEPWTLDRMAARVHLSRSALVERFRDVLDATPAQVLRQTRMRCARILLTDPSRSVTQVAFAVGYGSTAAFSRAFALEHGVAPRTWRADLGSADGDRRKAEAGQHRRRASQ